MSWHGPWVLAEIFRGGGGGASQIGPTHGKKPPYKENKIEKGPHREKGLP